MSGNVERLDVDATGLACPMPVIMTARSVKEHLEARSSQAAAGSQTELIVVVTATDPATRIDLPAWARMRGYSVVPEDTKVDGEPLMEAEPTPSGIKKGTKFAITISVPLA